MMGLISRLRHQTARRWLAAVLVLSASACSAVARPAVRFGADGKLRIVQFTDIHEDRTMDPRVLGDMLRIIDAEKPDFVMLTGDNVTTGQCKSEADLRDAIRQVCQAMTMRRVPWAAVFGNHDVDTLTNLNRKNDLHVTKHEMLEMYRAQPFNANPPDAKDVYGAGNGLLIVPSAQTGKPALGIWLIDSGQHAPAEAGGQKLGGWDFIRVSEVAWYYETSRRVEKRLGHKLPSLMFLHIPFREYLDMVATRPLVGDRKDTESPSTINSGMFAALLDRGDVLGVYCGHDHYNSYEGNYYGIRLGYGGAIKFAAKKPDPADEVWQNATRGARVFVIDENDPSHYESHFVHVSELK